MKSFRMVLLGKQEKLLKINKDNEKVPDSSFVMVVNY